MTQQVESNERSLYRDHLLVCTPSGHEDGGFRARAVIISVGGQKTVSQRFLDLQLCGTREEALSHAHRAAVEWVDDDWRDRVV